MRFRKFLKSETWCNKTDVWGKLSRKNYTYKKLADKRKFFNLEKWYKKGFGVKKRF